MWSCCEVLSNVVCSNQVEIYFFLSHFSFIAFGISQAKYNHSNGNYWASRYFVVKCHWKPNSSRAAHLHMVDSMSLMQKYTPFASINLQSLIMNHGSSNNSASNSCRLLWNCFLSQSPSLALKLRHRNDFWVYSHFFLLKYFVEILVKVKKWLQRTLKTIADKIKRQRIWRMVTKRRKK